MGGVLCAVKVGHTQLMAAQVPPCGGQAENGLVPLPVPRLAVNAPLYKAVFLIGTYALIPQPGFF